MVYLVYIFFKIQLPFAVYLINNKVINVKLIWLPTFKWLVYTTADCSKTLMGRGLIIERLHMQHLDSIFVT